MQLIKHNQFDTIYHEHFSYLSLYTVNKIFNKQGLKVFNVEEIETHGGSLRVYGCHKNDTRKLNRNVKLLLKKEKDFGLQKIKTYQNFQIKVNKIKDELISFLIKQKNNRKKVIAYGAAHKEIPFLIMQVLKKIYYHLFVMVLPQNKANLCQEVIYQFYLQKI